MFVLEEAVIFPNGTSWELPIQRPDILGWDLRSILPAGRFIVEVCKYNSRYLVDPEKVDQVIELKSRCEADHAVIITTSGFSDEAIETANSEGIQLIDGGELIKIFKKYGVDATL